MEEIKIFTLKQTGPVYADSTSKYIVELSDRCTLFDFIEQVLTRDKDWGNIKLNHNEESIEGVVLEYKYGEVKSSNISSILLNYNVKSVIAYGGYTVMDYIIEI